MTLEHGVLSLSCQETHLNQPPVFQCEAVTCGEYAPPANALLRAQPDGAPRAVYFGTHEVFPPHCTTAVIPDGLG